METLTNHQLLFAVAPVSRIQRNNRHRIESKISNQLRFTPRSHSLGSKKMSLSINHRQFGAIREIDRPKSSSFICAAAYGASCAGAQTLPLIDKPKTFDCPPIKDKTTSTPRLDDSGPNLPPWFPGGGGGGGGGGNTSGGFFLFGFLLILSFLKEEEMKILERKKREREELQAEDF